jgi:hypothetical protein
MVLRIAAVPAFRGIGVMGPADGMAACANIHRCRPSCLCLQNTTGGTKLRHMSEPRRTVTIHLPVSRYRRLERAARAERRSLDRHLEDLIERELAVQDEAGGAIRMFVPPDAESLRDNPGELLPTPGESVERYAERQQIFTTLMKLPIAG